MLDVVFDVVSVPAEVLHGRQRKLLSVKKTFEVFDDLNILRNDISEVEEKLLRWVYLTVDKFFHLGDVS